MKKILFMCFIALFSLGVANAQEPKKAEKKTVTTEFVTDIDCAGCAKKVTNTIPYEKGVNFVTVVDGFLVSDNIQWTAENIDADFLASADGGKFISALSAKVCLEQEEAYYTSPAFNGSSTARDQVGSLLSKCLTAAATDVDAMIDDAFIDAIDECEYGY